MSFFDQAEHQAVAAVPAIVPNDAKLTVLDKLRNILPVKRCEVLP